MSTKELNIFNRDKFKVIFSNIPSLSTNSDFDSFDMSVIHNNIQAITIPSISINPIEVTYKGSKVNYASSNSNNPIDPIVISFKVSERLTNYKAFINWMQNLKGNNVGYENTRKNIIKTISIIMLDNQKQETNIFKFNSCFLLNVSPLDLSFGNTEEVLFSITVQPEEFEF